MAPRYKLHRDYVYYIIYITDNIYIAFTGNIY